MLFLRFHCHVVCGLVWVWANNANGNNRLTHLAFPAHKWNVVDSNVTPFLALKFDFRSKWITPYGPLVLIKVQHNCGVGGMNPSSPPGFAGKEKWEEEGRRRTTAVKMISSDKKVKHNNKQ